MAWIYVPVLESVVGSGSNLEAEQSAISRTMTTASDYCKLESLTDSSVMPLSGTTCEVSMRDRGVAEWILSLVVSPVSHGQSQANKKESLIPVIFGPISSGSFAMWNPDSHSWKMSLDLFTAAKIKTLKNNSSLPSGDYLATWPRAGMTRSGIVYQLVPLAPLTGGIGCGWWRTPAAQEPGWKHIEVVDKDGNPPTHPNQRFYDKKTGRVVQQGLTQQVRMWPTPRAGKTTSETEENFRKRYAEGKQSTPPLALAVKMLPTPRAIYGEHPGMKDSSHLTGVANKGIGGQLNPTWVEWLMGWPLGWTDLNASATDGCHK